MDFKNRLQIYERVMTLTDHGSNIPVIDKEGVNVHAVTIFEDIILRNLGNEETTAIEINHTKFTYYEFYDEVERFMSAFQDMGIKEGDVVSLCLPVSVEFICSYFALTTLGATVNALNIMFLFAQGIEPYLSKRSSQTLICHEDYLKMLMEKGALNDSNLKYLIVTGDAPYTNFKGVNNGISVPDNLNGVHVTSLIDFLSKADRDVPLRTVKYNENRASTLNYTSGTTGKPKCMAHSDLAPLYLIAAHDTIPRAEARKDRTLITIPLQHPTGLFYAVVLQMAQGKTLVLEPRYDKRLFASDIKNLHINHAVQAKPFYAQLIQDKADGKIKPGDFAEFRDAYSGGEGIPLSVCKKINEVLEYAGCKYPFIALGYGRSEEGSLTIAPYNLIGRVNTVGQPLSGIKAKIVQTETLEDIPQVEGAKGEILVSTPVTPINHCYLDDYNAPGKPDGSIVDENGVRWARAKDIATLNRMPDNSLSYLVLGRADDNVCKEGVNYYLFEIKEIISDLEKVQECEVVSIGKKYITAHVVLAEAAKNDIYNIVKEIFAVAPMIDGVKIHEIFKINATSGKCDKEAMMDDCCDYYFLDENEEIIKVNFSGC